MAHGLIVREGDQELRHAAIKKGVPFLHAVIRNIAIDHLAPVHHPAVNKVRVDGPLAEAGAGKAGLNLNAVPEMVAANKRLADKRRQDAVAAEAANCLARFEREQW